MAEVPDDFQVSMSKGNDEKIDSQQIERILSEQPEQQQKTADQFDVRSIICRCPDQPFGQKSRFKRAEELVIHGRNSESKYFAKTLHEEDDAEECPRKQDACRPGG